MKKKESKMTIFILMTIMGVLLITQYKVLQSGIKYVSFADIEKLTRKIESKEIENDKLKVKIDDLKKQIDEYEASFDETENIESVIREDLGNYKKAAGIDYLYGPGVVVIVSDSDRKLLENENPNNLLVHDLDIQALVDDLINAGAEAIAINGQRVIPHTTEITCNGPTIKINNKLYSQPFIIEAIGNRKYLEAAINAPDKYGFILKQWGLFLEVNTSIYLEIPGYNTKIKFKYMKPKEN
ncbi:MAG: DUF881 domain-containing protein [Clostridiales bacterium]|nr:DUF881 domain-containing protein [Clostridiales bacterium]